MYTLSPKIHKFFHKLFFFSPPLPKHPTGKKKRKKRTKIITKRMFPSCWIENGSWCFYSFDKVKKKDFFFVGFSWKLAYSVVGFCEIWVVLVESKMVNWIVGFWVSSYFIDNWQRGFVRDDEFVGILVLECCLFFGL